MKEKFEIILREIFYSLSILLVVLVLFELLWPKLVLVYININYLLIFWLIIGIFTVVMGKSSKDKGLGLQN